MENLFSWTFICAPTFAASKSQPRHFEVSVFHISSQPSTFDSGIQKAAAKPKAAIALSSDRQAIIALIIFGSGKQSVDHSKWGLNTTSTLPMLFTNTGWYRRNRRANGEVIEKENGKCSWVKNHCENDIELPYLGQ